MIVYLLLGVTLLIAVISIWLLWRGAMVLGVALAMFIYLYGVWVFASVYGKYVFAAVAMAACVATFLRRSERAVSKLQQWVGVGMSAALLVLCVLYFTGTTGKLYGTINLALPFKQGTYLVFQGGRGLPTNVFHYSGRHTLYAMDIIKLNVWGGRAQHIFSTELEDYEIFNDTIYAPCSGVVLRAESSNPDNIPPLRKRGPNNLNGVLLGTDSAYIYLGHMKQNSVLVHVGDSVETGQPLGLAGNSGMSLEPHLHIQAHAKTFKGLPFYKEPQLLIRFDGREYLLFESIRAGR